MTTWLFRAAVSLVVALVLFRIIPLHSVADALGRISVAAWAVSLLVFFAGHYLNASKLRRLADAESVPLSTFVRAQYAGLVANLGLPGLAGGDLARAAYLVSAVGTRRIALASVADRIIDTLTLLLLVAVALPLAGMPPPIAGVVRAGSTWLMAGLAAIVLLAAIVVVLRRRPDVSKMLAAAWTELRNRQSAVRAAIAISVFVQTAFVLTNVWLARRVGVTTDVAAWFVAWPLSKLVAVLPISLGGIGVREAALVSLLAPYGASREGVLASGILWQAVLVVSGLTGLVITQFLRPRATADPIRSSANNV